jgi:DNA-binding NarL/FixJ family response regulator
VRVVIADDGVLFREGMARILTEIGFDVTGQAGDGTGLVDLVSADPPDVVITDLRMPPMFGDEGIEAAARIREIAPGVGIILLSQYVEVHHALRLMEDFTGGVGYLLKDRFPDLRASATDVGWVANGDVVVDPELVTRLVRRRRQRDPLDDLSDREREVLGMMARGLTNAALADALFVSQKTVEGYVRSIFTKLGLPPSEREHRRVLAVLQFLRQE